MTLTSMVRSGIATKSLLEPLGRSLRAPSAGRLGADHGSAVIDWAAYVDGQRVDTASVAEAMEVVGSRRHRRAGNDRNGRQGGGHAGQSGRGPSGQQRPFVWVGLHEPRAAEVEWLADTFCLHPLAAEDAIHAHQRPKLERYEDALFFVLMTAGYVAHERPDSKGAAIETIDTGEIMIFCGDDFVVTVRHGPHGDLAPVRRRMENEPALLARGPAAVVHAISDRVVDDYIAAADGVQQDIDDVEVSVFSPDRSNQVERIYRLKREVIELKRAVAPLIGALRSVAGHRFVPEETEEYFRDVEDHLARVCEQVESCDELLTPILQAHLTQVTVADNQDMRKISAWVAILAVPTAVAGIYGMNFDHMPETRFEYGYPVVLGVIATVCAMLYRGFRRNGWL